MDECHNINCGGHDINCIPSEWTSIARTNSAMLHLTHCSWSRPKKTNSEGCKDYNVEDDVSPPGFIDQALLFTSVNFIVTTVGLPMFITKKTGECQCHYELGSRFGDPCA